VPDDSEGNRGGFKSPCKVAAVTADRARPSGPWRGHRLRVVLLLLLVIAMAVLLSIPAMRDALDGTLVLVEPLLTGHPLVGRVLFVLVSALSAMLAFFSGAILVPAAVYAWGNAGTMVLLWCGWWLGGLATYAMGRMVRKPLLPTRRAATARDAYLDKMPANLSWSFVFLLQLALPSEVPGYLCGFLRVRFRTYATAMALAEIPYAVGTVLLGESIVHARMGWFIVLGLAAVGVLGGAAYVLRLRLRSDMSTLDASVPTGEGVT
jgi:uncharacterized membrane protein YdjX (TVP38/TMEM64 family)